MKDIPIARRDLIAIRLDKGAPVVASDLAAEFDVSEDAIRRDLRALAAEGRCRRVYGGALPISLASTPMDMRLDEARERKDALARVAASLVQPGQLIFLDNGSSNLAIVKFLACDSRITVATNSISIASEVFKRKDLQLIVVGGTVNLHLGGCVDASAIAMVSEMNFDHCYIGACAISVASGICAFDLTDAQFKKALITSGQHNVVLVTNEKLETRAPYRVSAINEIDHVIVEHEAPDEKIQPLVQADVALIRAAPI